MSLITWRPLPKPGVAENPGKPIFGTTKRTFPVLQYYVRYFETRGVCDTSLKNQGWGPSSLRGRLDITTGLKIWWRSGSQGSKPLNEPLIEHSMTFKETGNPIAWQRLWNRLQILPKKKRQIQWWLVNPTNTHQTHSQPIIRPSSVLMRRPSTINPLNSLSIGLIMVGLIEKKQSGRRVLRWQKDLQFGPMENRKVVENLYLPK